MNFWAMPLEKPTRGKPVQESILLIELREFFFYSRKSSAKIHKLISRFVPSNFLKNRAKTPQNSCP
jgi:hypothetical protein